MNLLVDLLEDIIVLNKKMQLSIVIVIAICALLLVFWFLQPKTPLAALEKEYTGHDENVLRYSSFIEQIDIKKGESLLFYFNGNSNVNCAVAEKKLFGYKIIDVNAELEPYNDELRVGLHGSTYESGDKWVYYGIIYDASVDKVIWNGVEGKRFTSSNLDMVYAFGDGEFIGEAYYLYDKDGNELEQYR